MGRVNKAVSGVLVMGRYSRILHRLRAQNGLRLCCTEVIEPTLEVDD